jgi:predicted RNA polymerase sigma factor
MTAHASPSGPPAGPVRWMMGVGAPAPAAAACTALDELDTLGDALDGYHLYHATRAELLRALGHLNQARGADERALELTANPAEQALLQQRISWG